jgi:hypothetical protein
MDENTEQIFLIYSVSGTHEDDLAAAQAAIRQYRRVDSTVRVEPLVFAVPPGASPGATLATEITNGLRSSIGAVVFVDDLRPNVAYELGFLHGQGRTVLLLTRESVDSVWTAISDIAGSALAHLGRGDLTSSIHSYLDRLYTELGRVKPLPAFALPLPETNLLRQLPQISTFEGYKPDGAFGPSLIVRSWEHVDIELGFNLPPNARFSIVVRATGPGADCSIYFRVRFPNRGGAPSRAWLGLASRRRVAGMRAEERTFPCQPPTKEWRMMGAEFDELLRLGSLLGSGPVYFLERVRFRAGGRGEEDVAPIEIGFLSITRLDA